MKRGWDRPQYEIITSEGPTHMREYQTRVTIGDKVALGKGRSKKESKRTAAEAMMNNVCQTNLSLQPPNKRIAFVPAGAVSQRDPIVFQRSRTL